MLRASQHNGTEKSFALSCRTLLKTQKLVLLSTLAVVNVTDIWSAICKSMTSSFKYPLWGYKQDHSLRSWDHLHGCSPRDTSKTNWNQPADHARAAHCDPIAH